MKNRGCNNKTDLSCSLPGNLHVFVEPSGVFVSIFSGGGNHLRMPTLKVTYQPPKINISISMFKKVGGGQLIFPIFLSNLAEKTAFATTCYVFTFTTPANLPRLYLCTPWRERLRGSENELKKRGSFGRSHLLNNKSGRQTHTKFGIGRSRSMYIYICIYII